jgi:drug/metabolite transporter (DMT)-like permease
VHAKNRAELVLAGVTLLWAATFLITRQGLAFISPVLLVAARFGLAFVVLALPWRSEFRRRPDRRTVRGGLLLGLLLCIGYVLQTVGLKYTSVGNSAFITYTFAVFTVLLEALVMKRRPGVWILAGLALVMAGLFMQTRPLSSGMNFGDLLTLGCALAYSVYMVYLNVFSNPGNQRMLLLIQFGFTAVLALLASPFLEQPFVSPAPALFLAVGYLGILGTAAAIGLQNRHQRDSTPSRAAIIFSIEPVAALLLAVALAGERPSAGELAGGLLILAGVALASLKRGEDGGRATGLGR